MPYKASARSNEYAEAYRAKQRLEIPFSRKKGPKPLWSHTE